MVYKHHQFVREVSETGDSSVWPDDVDPIIKSRLKNLRRSHPRIPYTLEIESSTYWGNYEREFIAYSMGILDDVQMRIKHSKEELEMFWAEVFGKKPPKFAEALEEYELLRDYLFETFQDVDDWYQLTFYQIDWDILHRDVRNIIRIQLAKPLSKEWEEIIIPRMKAFFEKKIYKWMTESTELIGIRLVDSKGNCIKRY